MVCLYVVGGRNIDGSSAFWAHHIVCGCTSFDMNHKQQIFWLNAMALANRKGQGTLFEIRKSKLQTDSSDLYMIIVCHIL